MMYSDVREFVAHSLHLLSTERATELAQSETAHSIDTKSNTASLHALVVASQKVCINQRLIFLTKKNKQTLLYMGPLPKWMDFRP